MDVLREINYAEKAGSGFDKIFTALLSKGKKLPQPIQTENSILLRIDADVYSEKLVELSLLYKQITKKDIDLEKLIVLNHIYTGQRLTFQQLEKLPFVNHYQLRKILAELQEIEFIEPTGRTSGVKYIIHKTKLANVEDEKNYLRLKKQTTFKMKQTILKYLEEFEEINNSTARDILSLTDDDIYKVSRILKQMRDNEEIEMIRNDKGITYYAKKN
jgi:predicted HTH transcriptional regulator